MDYGLTGKVALITGAGSQMGFGKATALTLAKEGCDIIVNDINLEDAELTAAEIRSLGRKAIAIKADVANKDEVQDMVKTALKEFGKIDILVNNAGMTTGGGPLEQTNEEAWDVVININVKGAMNCSKAVLPQMLERKYGKIVNFSSLAARMGLPRSSVYTSAKAAIIGFTKALGAEVAPSGINVNALAPGMALTNFMPGSKITDEGVQAFISQVPIRRVGTTQDIANTVAFLVSDVSSNIVGQTISVDGGMYRV
jgi:3-oxoacyl-[acyl-carrier protein] reductase